MSLESEKLITVSAQISWRLAEEISKKAEIRGVPFSIMAGELILSGVEASRKLATTPSSNYAQMDIE